MTLLEQHLQDIPNPCYVMEEDLLRRNLSLIQSVAEHADVEIILAFKAFALWKSFSIFREYIHHTTASSPYEARLAFEEFGSKAHTYSPAYEDETIDVILRCSSHITFNSLSQLERFGSQARTAGVSVGLRINPGYSEIETELYNPCAPGSRFGVDSQQLPSTIEGMVDGFHVHNHCESSAEAFARSLQHVEEKFSSWFPQLKWINFGGGHLMTRKGYNVDLLVQTLKDFHRRWPHLHVILEPGSAFAWQTGPLVARVVDIVENHNIRTAILNVSFTCHMPDCLEMPYQPEVRGAAPLHLPPIGGGLPNQECNYYKTTNKDVYSILHENALNNRQHPTDAETAMWSMLRGKSLGVKFRRQHPIGDYIADFACIEKRIIVEVDGAYHMSEKQKQDDMIRTSQLENYGYHVLRFSNEEVIGNSDAVLQQIRQALVSPPIGGSRRGAVYRLGGNSCLSGDVMGDWYFDHELQVGEVIIFEDMIHYTTVKTTMFNGIHHPFIGLLHSDGTFELYREFTYEDYRDRMC